MLKGLYGITSEKILALPELQLLDAIQQSCSAGLNILQYRQKSENKISLITLKKIQSICFANKTLFIINDDIDLALAIKADGVHIGQDDEQLIAARKKAGQKFIIGVSCYNSLEGALIAQHNGASYVAFGAMFSSSTKPNAPKAELSTILKAKQQLDIPICVIGGISIKNIDSLLSESPDMIAIVSDIFNRPNIHKATKQLLQAIG